MDIQTSTALQDAINAVSDGIETTIVLTHNITMSKGSAITVPANKIIILNMDGKSIETVNDYEGRPFENNGILTITGNGRVDSSASLDGYGAINNRNTLTIINGTFRGHRLSERSTVRNLGGTSKLTIMDGVFDTTTAAIYNEGIATINGGKFIGDTCNLDGINKWSYTIKNWTSTAKTIINDGYFVGVQGAISNTNGYLEINGGNFRSVKCTVHPDAIVNTTVYYAVYAAPENGNVEVHIQWWYF